MHTSLPGARAAVFHALHENEVLMINSTYLVVVFVHIAHSAEQRWMMDPGYFYGEPGGAAYQLRNVLEADEGASEACRGAHM